MDAVLAGVQLAKQHHRREEDIRQRLYENEARRIEDARRDVDMKTEQLKAVSNLAALIAGFSMMLLVESNYPDLDKLSPPLIWVFGGVTTLVVCLNLISLMVTSLMLVAVLNFDADKSVRAGELSFHDFWRSRCEKDWVFAFKAFIYGMPLFVCDVVLIVWIVFYQSTTAASIVTALGGMVLLLFICYAIPAWGGGATQPVFNRNHVIQRAAALTNGNNNNNNSNGQPSSVPAPASTPPTVT